MRNGLIVIEQLLRRVTRIATEQFVATIASEHLAAAIGASQLGAVVRRQRRGIAERLIVVLRNRRQAGDQIGRGDVVFVMLAAEMSGGDARVLHFIVALRIEADRVDRRRPAGDLAEHAGDCRTVCTAGKKGADTGVVADLLVDAVTNQVAKGFTRVAERLPMTIVETQWPVALQLCAVCVDVQAVSGRQPLYLAEDCPRRRDHVKVQIIVNRLCVDVVTASGNAVRAVGKSQYACFVAIAHRFDGKTVDGDQHAATAVVDDAQCIAAAELVDHGSP